MHALSRDELLCIIEKSAMLVPKLMVQVRVECHKRYICVYMANVYDGHEILTIDAIVTKQPHDLVKAAKRLLNIHFIGDVTASLLAQQYQWLKIKKFLRDIEQVLLSGDHSVKTWEITV